MRIYCISRYSSSLGSWEPGQEIDLSEEVCALLLRDSPGSFSESNPNTPESNAPTLQKVAKQQEARQGEKPGSEAGPGQQPPPADQHRTFKDMSIPELRAYADEREINLAGARSKPQIIEQIEAAAAEDDSRTDNAMSTETQSA